jgi:bifunctional oligoribonuclease and PAP phosphatase NrnA
MDKQHRALKRYIEKAQRILVVSHRGPDMDAFCSMLLVKEFLNIYYPDKSVVAKAKQMPNFNIPRMHEISVVDTLEEGDEDLIVIVDTADMNIVCDREDNLIDTNTDIVVIDHHLTTSGRQKVLINEERSSATEQVIASFKQILGKKFKLTKEIAELGQYGITADTGGFMYEVTTADTFRLFADLFEFSPIDIEEFEIKSKKFPLDSTPIMAELLRRLSIEGDMAYTYVNIDDTKRWDKTSTSRAANFVINHLIRYIQSVHWGFILKPSTRKINTWWVSFRSTKGYQRVDKIAEDLGGGGHMYASGAKLEYSEPRSLEQVLTDVFTVIKKHLPPA